MTITLHGLPISNYYNKVKMALLEKGVPFEESHAPTRSADPAHRAASPLGKVPFITTPQGTLCESQVIVDWIEAAFPQPALLPADPFEAAKVREITTFIDWHLEMAARQLYGQAFFGAPPLSEANLARIRRQVQDAVAGFRQLARFAPYVAGEQFTQADLSACNSLPLVALATKKVLGEDLLAAAGIDWKAYAGLIAQRPSAQKVDADKKADAARMAEAAKK